jgi:hypothetical protein
MAACESYFGEIINIPVYAAVTLVVGSFPHALHILISSSFHSHEV